MRKSRKLGVIRPTRKWRQVESRGTQAEEGKYTDVLFGLSRLQMKMKKPLIINQNYVITRWFY